MQDVWISRYVDLMFGPKHTFDTMTEAAKLKFQHMPEKLYKYRSFNDYTWDALETDTLFVNLTSKQNDKREANIIVTHEAEVSVLQQMYDDLRIKYGLPSTSIENPEEFVMVVHDHFRTKALLKGQVEADLSKMPIFDTIKEDLIRSFNEFMSGVRRNVREMYSICCFSASNNNDLMWAHYAESFSGCCIEYPFKSLGSDHLHVALMFPAIYVNDNRVYMNYYNPEAGLDGALGMFAATLKQNKWAYEEEWRRLYTAADGGKTHSMIKPTAVYMGENIKTSDKQKLTELCNRRGIELYQMVYDQTSDSIRAI